MTVGVVGLGTMGLRMARALGAAGTDVLGHDASPAARSGAEGAPPVVDHLTDLAGCTHVVLSLPGPDAVLATVRTLAEAGYQGVVLDTSTCDPGTSRACDEMLAGRFADCPILGRPSAIGGWTIPVGGSDALAAAAQRVLAPCAARIVSVGPVGTASTIKVVNNMMLSAINAATAEALMLAASVGVDPGLFVDTVLESGAASVSGLFREVAPRAVDGTFDPQFSVRLMRKDAGLALAMAETAGVPLFVAPAAQQLNTLALKLGYGEDDSIAVLKVLEGFTDIRARRHKG